MSEVVDIKVVSMKSWCRNESLVEMLEVMLEAAKEGSLVGAAGVFMIYGEEPKGSCLGTMMTENMQDNVFTVVGALEKVKMSMLASIEPE